MGKLTVHFLGLCTHIRFSAMTLNDPSLPPHRVVLVVADQDMIFGHQVGKHDATLILPDGQQGMTGLRLCVANAEDGCVTYDRSFLEPPDCVPPLKSLTPALTDADLDSRVVMTGETAASHFDIRSGAFRAGRDPESKAIIATADIETHGPPVLVLERLASGEEVARITFDTDEQEISFANKDVDRDTEREEDFLWHYKIFSEIEKKKIDPRLPDPTNCKQPRGPSQPSKFDTEINGPGCSNSTWP